MSGNLLPPYDALAEQAIVAAVLSDPACLLDVLDVMRPEDVYGRPEREFLRLAAGLHSDGVEFGSHALMRVARDQGVAEIVSSSWVAGMLDVPVPASAKSCALVVHARSRQRRALKVLRTLTVSGEQPDIDVDAWLAEVERQVYETGAQSEIQPVVSLRDTLAEVAALVAARSRGDIDYLPTTLWDLNRIILGWAVGKLHIVAGDPGDGKTSFWLQEAVNAATQGWGVVLFSYEMTRTELVEVLIGQLSGIASDALQSGKLSQSDWTKYAEAQSRLDPLPIAIIDAHVGLAELRSKARREYARLQRDHGGKLRGLVIGVDYIQLMPGSGDDYERISHNSTGLALLAKERSAIVIATSQFNRENKAGQSGKRRRHSMRDLKGSGSLEQDAHKIILLYNEHAHLEKSEQPPDRTGIVAKNRGGRTGDARMLFDGPRRRFTDDKHESHDWVDDMHEGLPPTHWQGDE